MITAYILLQATINCPWEMLMGLLISLIPALLAWLAARSYYKVAEKDDEIRRLTASRNELDGKVNSLTGDLTNVRLALSKAEADVEDKTHRLINLRNDLIIAESERNLLREKMGPDVADAYLKANVSQPVEFDGVYYAANDFKLFKGVDGDLSAKLYGAGFKTWSDLADADNDQLEAVLAGSGLSAADLIKQARFAVNGDWNGLKSFQTGLMIVHRASRNPEFIEFDGRRWRYNDLEIVEGIGPKIAGLLNNAGINTWDELCKTSPERIMEILHAAGPDYQMHDPATWPNQACLAAAGDWDALKILQDQLIGGRGNVSSRHPETVDFNGRTYIWDDLKIVEGIGPKIEELFHQAGIRTWQQLSETDPDRLKEILEAAGPNYSMHDPGSWPQQAGLAHEQRWDDLQRLQEELTGGR